MGGLIKDFKGFALSGNVVDLAIGVILGVAFGAVVDTFANDLLLGVIGAIFTVPDPSNLSLGINGTEVYYGKFLGALMNFLLIAGVLLLVVKLLMRVGMNFRAQGNRECDFCKSFVPVDATKCMFCTSEIEPVMPD
ncbi:MAG: large conductance mechanosensitive channel protein MscL [Kineosporiaceae bacterium]